MVFDWDHTIASAHMYSELQYQQPGGVDGEKYVDYSDTYSEEYLTAYLNQHYPGIAVHLNEERPVGQKIDAALWDRAMKKKVDEDFIEMWGRKDRGARLLALHEMLHNLRSGDIRPHLYILSDGIESEIERALEILGLRDYFREVVGKYEDRLKYLDRITSIRRRGETKNDFLQHLVTQGYGRILFVDDSHSNIDKAQTADLQRAGVSTLEVTGVGTGADHQPCSFPTPKVCARHGLDPKDMMEKYAEFLASVVPVHLWTTAEPVGPGHLYTIYE